MDAFTQRMLERAEKRANNFGMTNTLPKQPLSECKTSNENLQTTNNTTKLSSSAVSPAVSKRYSSTTKSSPHKNVMGQQEMTVRRTKDNNDNDDHIQDDNNKNEKQLKVNERQFTSEQRSKENVDVAVEINITSGPNVQVQVEVEEQEVDSHGQILSKTNREATSVIRDTSRNHLQRLGALYSDTEHLSSPIHRSEARYDEEEIKNANAMLRNSQTTTSTGQLSKSINPKYGKLAALADSIKNWEDDPSHPDYNDCKRRKSIKDNQKANDKHSEPRIVDTTPRKNTTGAIPKQYPTDKQSPQKTSIIKTIQKTQTQSTECIQTTKPTATTTVITSTNDNSAPEKPQSKQLKWDQKVMDHLELQGFKRRESNLEKLTYDYNNPIAMTSSTTTTTTTTGAIPSTTTNSNSNKKYLSNAEISLNSVTTTTEVKSSNKIDNNNDNNGNDKANTKKENRKSIQALSSKGLVSDRTALFDKPNCDDKNNKTTNNLRIAAKKAATTTITTGGGSKFSHKDPAEMSLKERLAMFEKNKGEALIPKAALGISASSKQIMTTSSQNDKLMIDDKKSQYQQRDQSQDSHGPIDKSPTSKITGFNQSVFAESKATGNCIRSTVAALTSNAKTMSESQISNEIRKQREQEMNVLLNRFTNGEQSEQQQQEKIDANNKMLNNIIQKPSSAPPAPPPPPMPSTTSVKSQNHISKPQHIEVECILNQNNYHKRRSDEKREDSDEVRKSLDDIKRIKIIPTKKGKLYPALSDIESTAAESDLDNYTTATVSTENLKMNSNNKRSSNQRNVTNQDVEKEDSYMDSEVDDGDDDDSSNDICNLSLGREIMHAVRLNESAAAAASATKSNGGKPYHEQYSRYNKQQPHQYLDSSTSEPSGNFSDGEMDDYLDEALEDDEVDEQDDGNYHKRKGSMSSNSFSYEKPNRKHVHYQTINEEDNKRHYNYNDNDRDDDEDDNDHEGDNDNRLKRSQFTNPIKSELKVNPSKDNDIVTLTHTVSFYRRQQQQYAGSSSAGNSRKITRNKVNEEVIKENYDGEEDDDDDVDSDDDNVNVGDHPNRQNIEKELIYEKEQKLLDEICKQQQFISQSSQALNLCAATIEFSGSTESVEAERHLLVASHRRLAALNELQRLRVERCIRASDAPTERGRLIIKDITIPLKPDYIRKLSTDSITGHHFVCLVKYNENVLATKTIPTLPGLLAVKFPDVLQLNNVYSDFKITLEIYGMTAHREILPHDIKYHITPIKKGAIKTPKGKKGGYESNCLIMPPVQSPAGPNAVRTPSLIQYGFIIFSLREYQRNSWTMNQTSGVSPLDGMIHMKVTCDISATVNHKGFLTMFEDVSGFGAWHRRWCRLHGNLLSYWKYPDDENKKAPIGSFDMNTCNSKKIHTAPRDICARINTFLLELKRPAEENDVDSLTIVRHGKYSIVRCLLSADTKEEREEWCLKLNKTLSILRSWGNTQQ